MSKDKTQIEDLHDEGFVEETLEEGTVAQDSLKPASRSVSDPKSKVEYITSMIGAMHTMKKEDLVKWYNDTMSQFGPGKDYGVGDKSASNAATLKMKPSAAGGAGANVKMSMPKLSVKEDVEEMFNGQDLSEEFKENAAALFEAAVTARAMVEFARLEEEFEAKLEEQVAEISEELTSKVDSYLDYVTESWMKENEVAIESTLRNEIMEEFIDGLQGLFAEHYISVPQEKVDVLEALADKVSALEEKLDESINENVELKRIFAEVEKEEVLSSLSEGLALTQQEKFKALAEGIEFDGDIESYTNKLTFVKENYFGQKQVATSTNIEEETFEGETSVSTVAVDPVVNRYVQAISKTVKK